MRQLIITAIAAVCALPARAEEPTLADNGPRLIALAKLLDIQHQMGKLQLEYTELWVQTHSKGVVGNGYQDLGGYWYKDGFFYYPYKTEDGWKYHKRDAVSRSGVYRVVGGVSYYVRDDGALLDRVRTLEKSLGIDVPVDKAVTPAFVAERAAEKEKNKDALRRRQLYQHINNQLDYQFADASVKSASIAELFVKPKDATLEAVLAEYRTAGWDVQHEPGEQEGLDHWRFQPAEGK